MSRCSKTKMLFDYLVGASQHRRRKVEADRPRGLEIYHQFGPGWLLDRKITRVCAAHDLVNIGCGASPQIGTAGPIARASPPSTPNSRDSKIIGSRFDTAKPLIWWRNARVSDSLKVISASGFSRRIAVKARSSCSNASTSTERKVSPRLLAAISVSFHSTIFD